MALDPNTPITIPALTLEHARILEYHFHEGRRTKDRYVRVEACATAMHTMFGFSAHHWMTELVYGFEPPMLFFEPARPEKNVHKLDDRFFADPVPLFEAIRAAQQRAIDEARRQHELAAKANPDLGEFRCEIELSPFPDDQALAVSAERGPSGPAPTLKIGDIVATKDGPAELVRNPDGSTGMRLIGFAKSVARGGVFDEAGVREVPGPTVPPGSRWAPGERKSSVRRKEQAEAAKPAPAVTPKNLVQGAGKPAGKTVKPAPAAKKGSKPATKGHPVG